MFRKHFLVLLAAATTVAGCSSPTAPRSEERPPTPSARLGTVSPAYPVGTDLERGVEVVESIPTADLSTDEPLTFDTADPCASVPAALVTPAGFDADPVHGGEFGCVWRGSGLGLEIGAQHNTMAREVEAHLDMAVPGSTDPLTHLAWLRIDGHYAIERSLKFDPAKSCWLALDVSALSILRAVVYQVDSAGEPIESDRDTVCPAVRHVAANLLNYLEILRPWFLRVAR